LPLWVPSCFPITYVEEGIVPKRTLGKSTGIWSVTSLDQVSGQPLVLLNSIWNLFLKIRFYSFSKKREIPVY
jgi:hypothetical protein